MAAFTPTARHYTMFIYLLISFILLIKTKHVKAAGNSGP
jgi:hypothetical protein